MSDLIVLMVVCQNPFAAPSPKATGNLPCRSQRTYKSAGLSGRPVVRLPHWRRDAQSTDRPDEFTAVESGTGRIHDRFQRSKIRVDDSHRFSD